MIYNKKFNVLFIHVCCLNFYISINNFNSEHYNKLKSNFMYIWSIGLNLSNPEELLKEHINILDALYKNIIYTNALIINFRLKYKNDFLYLYSDFKTYIGLEILKEMIQKTMCEHKNTILCPEYLFGGFQYDFGFGIDLDPIQIELVLLSIFADILSHSPYRVRLENFIFGLRINLAKIINRKFICSLQIKNYNEIGLFIILEL